MELSETFQIDVMIEKLPLLWNDFKNHLKHKHKYMTIKDLIVRLCIEENNMVAKKKSSMQSMEVEANMIEDSKSKSKKTEHLSSSKDNGKGNEAILKETVIMWKARTSS